MYGQTPHASTLSRDAAHLGTKFFYARKWKHDDIPTFYSLKTVLIKD